jgi:hypothetical protein
MYLGPAAHGGYDEVSGSIFQSVKAPLNNILGRLKRK